ncbi:sigma-54 interaction domain-containing protein [Ramlibacter sp. AN1133]|uniref:sigma-54 interaction domain-containing protein n=1 Tax=Ramlibacter sp. AN1133 TaxID=3133429 RepID=UPI0030C52EBE
MSFTAAADAGLIGHNRGFGAALEFARKAARHACPLLIVGETGTGKDEVARLVHALSPRADGPFVSLNCAALPDTLIESELFGYERGAFTGAGRSYPGRFMAADHGTLFLDELGDLPLASQAKLLRAIEHGEITPLGSTRARKVDLRIVAATHQPLERMVREQRFRQDLFYRLNVARVHLPPLRNRRDDILELAAHFMAPLRQTQEGARVGWFDASALNRLLTHVWPGNVRELRNVIEAIFIDPPDGPITERCLPAYLTHAQGWEDDGGEDAGEPGIDERQRILDSLCATHWNKSAAARQLRWSRVTLYRKMAKHEITRGTVAE